MDPEQHDVVIIGAGLSGIGAAVHLQKHHPDKSFVILEMREAMGGTWDLFRYPGIRSDSDMYTLGYKFKPWTNPKSIADGESIRHYIEETAREYRVDRKIRYRQRVVGLDFSSEDALWRIAVEDLETGKEKEIASRFVIGASGYYNYEHGYTPHFEGREDFEGTIIHPQHWPEDLDYEGKRIVVIGSGATAVTLVPALTDRAAHVTMLQRSPGYVINVPEKDMASERLRQHLPETVVYHLARTRNVLISMAIYNFARRFPDKAREFFLEQTKRQLGDDFDMAHFTPSYDVWDERLCAVPNGDLFRCLRRGTASVVTGQIERFTEKGILLESGEELGADIIVTATGLEVQILGGADLRVDGEPVNVPEKMYYKGAMLEDVPNLAMVFGYTNSSWTLKADLILEYFCEVLRYMDEKGYAQCTPRHDGPREDGGPFVDLTSGYIKRAIDKLPRQGRRRPWKLYQNYVLDYFMMKRAKVDDGALVFSNPPTKRREQPAGDERGAASKRPSETAS